MQNMCINCERHPARGSEVLCHSCATIERNHEVDQINLRDSREFKFDRRKNLVDRMFKTPGWKERY